MIITWIDKKSVLYSNKRRFKAGDVIPAGILSQNRIDSLLIDKKIKIDAVVKTSNTPHLKVDFNKSESVVITKAKSDKKSSEIPKLKKSKAQLDEEELQRLIDEEAISESKNIDLDEAGE